MASKLQILSLYKSLLREADKFYNYNFRHYALRRIRDAFKEKKNLTDPKDIQKEFLFALDNLATIKRQVSPFERKDTFSPSESQRKFCSTELADEDTSVETEYPHKEQCGSNVNVNQPSYMLSFTPKQHTWQEKDTEEVEHIPEISYTLHQPPTYLNQYSTTLNSSCTEQVTVDDSCELKESSAFGQKNEKIYNLCMSPEALEQSYQTDTLSEIKQTSNEPLLEISDGTCNEETIVEQSNLSHVARLVNSPKVNDMTCIKQTLDVKNSLKTKYSNCMVPTVVAQNLSKKNVSSYNQQKTYAVEQNSLNQDSINSKKINNTSSMNPTTDQYNTPSVDDAMQPRTVTETDACSIQPAKLEKKGLKVFIPKKPTSSVEPSKTGQFNANLDSSCKDSDKLEVNSSEVNDFSFNQAATASEQKRSTFNVGNPINEQNYFKVNDSFNKEQPVIVHNGSKINDSFFEPGTAAQLNTTMSGSPCVESTNIPNSYRVDNFSNMGNPIESTTVKQNKPEETQHLMQQYLLKQYNTHLSSSSVKQPLDEHNDFKINVSSSMNPNVADLSTKLSSTPCMEPVTVEQNKSQTSTLIDQNSKKFDSSSAEQTKAVQSNSQIDDHTFDDTLETSADSTPLKIKYSRLVINPRDSTKLDASRNQQPTTEQKSLKVDSYYLEPLVEQKNLKINSCYVEPTVRCNSLEIPEISLKEIELLEQYAKQLNIYQQNSSKIVYPCTETSKMEQNNLTINDSLGIASTPAGLNVSTATHSQNIQPSLKMYDSSCLGASEQNTAQSNTQQISHLTWMAPNINEAVDNNENCMHSVTIDVRDNSVTYTPCVDSIDGKPFCPNVNTSCLPSVTIDLRDNSVKYTPYVGEPCYTNTNDKNTPCVLTATTAQCPNVISYNNNVETPYMHTTVDKPYHDNVNNISTPVATGSQYSNFIYNNSLDSPYLHTVGEPFHTSDSNTPCIPMTIAAQSPNVNNNVDTPYRHTTVGETCHTNDNNSPCLPMAIAAQSPNVNNNVDTPYRHTTVDKSFNTNVNDINTPNVPPATGSQYQNVIYNNNNLDSPHIHTTVGETCHTSVNNTPYIPTATVAQYPNVINNNVDTPYMHANVGETCHTSVNNTPYIPTATVAQYPNVINNNVNTPYMHTNVGETCHTSVNNTPYIPTATVAQYPNVINNNVNTPYMHTNVGDTFHTSGNNTPYIPTATVAQYPNVINNNVDTPYMHTNVGKTGHRSGNHTPYITTATVALCPNVINNEVDTPYMHTHVVEPCHTSDNNKPHIPTATVAQSSNVNNNKVDPPYYVHTTTGEPCNINVNDKSTPRVPTATVGQCRNVINNNNSAKFSSYMHAAICEPCYTNDNNTPGILTTEVIETFIGNDIYRPFIHTTAVDPNTFNTKTDTVGECKNENNTFYMHPTVGELNNANLYNTSCMQTTIRECANVKKFCMEPSTVGQYMNVNNTFYMDPTVDENDKNVNEEAFMQTDVVNQSSANISSTPCMSTEVEIVNDCNMNSTEPKNYIIQDKVDILGDDDCTTAKMATIQQCCANLTPILDFAALEEFHLELTDVFEEPIIYQEFWYHQPHFQADLAELDY